MIRYTSERQLPLDGFLLPFGGTLNPSNRWIKLSTIPWDDLVKGYHNKMNADQGRPAKNGRLVIGAVIIKHKLNLSDEETVRQIQENPYLQYFVGFSRYQDKPPFVPSLFVEIRRRMGSEVFDAFEKAILARLEESHTKKAAGKKSPADSGTRSGGCSSKQEESVCCNTNPNVNAAVIDPGDEAVDHKVKIVIDATVAKRHLCFPTRYHRNAHQVR